ncbi:MAG: hypothetical protein ACYC3W_10555 [Candidatus Nanopelagicales bacterium]
MKWVIIALYAVLIMNVVQAKEIKVDAAWTTGQYARSGTFNGARDSTHSSSGGTGLVAGSRLSASIYQVDRFRMVFLIPDSLNASRITGVRLFLNGVTNGSTYDDSVTIVQGLFAPTTGTVYWPMFQGREIGAPHSSVLLFDWWSMENYTPDWNVMNANAVGLQFIKSAVGDSIKLTALCARDVRNLMHVTTQGMVTFNGYNKADSTAYLLITESDPELPPDEPEPEEETIVFAPFVYIPPKLFYTPLERIRYLLRF